MPFISDGSVVMPPDITVTLLFVRTAPWDKATASQQTKHMPGMCAKLLRGNSG